MVETSSLFANVVYYAMTSYDLKCIYCTRATVALAKGERGFIPLRYFPVIKNRPLCTSVTVAEGVDVLWH